MSMGLDFLLGGEGSFSKAELSDAAEEGNHLQILVLYLPYLIRRR